MKNWRESVGIRMILMGSVAIMVVFAALALMIAILPRERLEPLLPSLQAENVDLYLSANSQEEWLVMSSYVAGLLNVGSLPAWNKNTIAIELAAKMGSGMVIGARIHDSEVMSGVHAFNEMGEVAVFTSPDGEDFGTINGIDAPSLGGATSTLYVRSANLPAPVSTLDAIATAALASTSHVLVRRSDGETNVTLVWPGGEPHAIDQSALDMPIAPCMIRSPNPRSIVKTITTNLRTIDPELADGLTGIAASIANAATQSSDGLTRMSSLLGKSTGLSIWMSGSSMTFALTGTAPSNTAMDPIGDMRRPIDVREIPLRDDIIRRDVAPGTDSGATTDGADGEPRIVFDDEMFTLSNGAIDVAHTGSQPIGMTCDTAVLKRALRIYAPFILTEAGGTLIPRDMLLTMPSLSIVLTNAGPAHATFTIESGTPQSLSTGQ